MDPANSLDRKNGPKILVLGGPTAAGKSKLALAIAAAIPCEIVNADSRQIYRHLTVGTSQPLPSDLRQVPHHLYAFLDPRESFTAADFERAASRLISEIGARRRLPLLVGGTGFYIRALLRGVWPVAPKNEELRTRLRRIAARHNKLFLHTMLLRLDPAAAASIAPPDTYRLIRALEIFFLTGVRRSELPNKLKERYSALKFYVNIARQQLHSNIEQRTELMFRRGWVEEVRALLKTYPEFEKLPAANSLGYREIIRYLNGEINAEECKNQIVLRTRQYAKRQLTWFRNQDDFLALSPEVSLRKTVDSVLQWYRNGP